MQLVNKSEPVDRATDIFLAEGVDVDSLIGSDPWEAALDITEIGRALALRCSSEDGVVVRASARWTKRSYSKL